MIMSVFLHARKHVLHGIARLFFFRSFHALYQFLAVVPGHKLFSSHTRDHLNASRKSDSEN